MHIKKELERVVHLRHSLKLSRVVASEILDCYLHYDVMPQVIVKHLTRFPISRFPESGKDVRHVKPVPIKVHSLQALSLLTD